MNIAIERTAWHGKYKLLNYISLPMFQAHYFLRFKIVQYLIIWTQVEYIAASLQVFFLDGRKSQQHVFSGKGIIVVKSSDGIKQ
jgi:hypothetical protein